jgi:hypothetical protein
MLVAHGKDVVSGVAGIIAQLILCLGAPRGVHFLCRIIILEVTVTIAYSYTMAMFSAVIP